MKRTSNYTSKTKSYKEDSDLENDLESQLEIPGKKRKIIGKSISKNGKTVEQIYQKKTQLEHILLRPDTYVGSIEMTPITTFLLNPEKKKFIQKEVDFVPALYKVFDEILSNAGKSLETTLTCLTYLTYLTF